MAGIYGNDPEDRYYERMLDRYLDELDEMLYCKQCGEDVWDSEELEDGICKGCRGEYEDE